MYKNKFNLSRKYIEHYKFTNEIINRQLINTKKFSICFNKISALIFLMINLAYAKLPFIKLQQMTNLSQQLSPIESLYNQKSLLNESLIYLTNQDFINAKYVKTNKPLKSIMNDQHFSVSAQLKVFINNFFFKF